MKSDKPISLSELRALAQAEQQQARPTLVRLLLVWAETDPGGELAQLLHGTGLDLAAMERALCPLLDLPSEEDRQLLLSCITDLSSEAVTGQTILQALCRQPDHRLNRQLKAAGLQFEALEKRLQMGQQKEERRRLAKLGITEDRRPNPLLQYGRDLTLLAEERAFDELCDRPEEIDRLLEVLLRKQKGNAALTGPAGVGKTALVELLARRLARNEVPEVLRGTRLFEIRMGALVAGTRYRGEFEERMEQVLEALMLHQPAILFIDEMHLIWGAGRAEGVITDAANLLKPFLARGTLRVIGATTVEEYHRYIARDAALARRFEEVRLSEPDEALTLLMIRTQAAALAAHHEIAILEPVLRHAIALTNQHLPNRHQPDKSVNLLDSACVATKRKT